MHITEPFIEDYLARLFPEQEGYLGELRAFAEDEGIPIVDRQVENFLQFFLALLAPKKILELGTAVGYSASLMARAVDDAEITTVELDPDRAINARTHFQNQHLEERIHLVVGDGRDFIQRDEDLYDFIFIDAAKGQYEIFLKESLRRLAPGGVIVMDNVLFHGMLASKQLFKRRKITIVKRLKHMLHAVLRAENLSATVLPIGDGLLLVRRLDG